MSPAEVKEFVRNLYLSSDRQNFLSNVSAKEILEHSKLEGVPEPEVQSALDFIARNGEETIAIHESEDSEKVIERRSILQFPAWLWEIWENSGLHGVYYKDGELMSKDIWDEEKAI